MILSTEDRHNLRQCAALLGLRLRLVFGRILGRSVAIHEEEMVRVRTELLSRMDVEAEYLSARSAAARERLRQSRMTAPVSTT